jgi:hypothetical protein
MERFSTTKKKVSKIIGRAWLSDFTRCHMSAQGHHGHPQLGGIAPGRIAAPALRPKTWAETAQKTIKGPSVWVYAGAFAFLSAQRRPIPRPIPVNVHLNSADDNRALVTHNPSVGNGGPLPRPWLVRGAVPPLIESGRGAMTKYHARPSLQYRYEHYDPIDGADEVQYQQRPYV